MKVPREHSLHSQRNAQMTPNLWPTSCDTNLFMEDKYVIFKWFLRDRRWNYIPREDHNVKGLVSSRLSSCLIRSFQGTYRERADELARHCGKPRAVGWDQHPRRHETSKLWPCPSAGLQFCPGISSLHTCLKYNEEFDKDWKGVTTNN